MFGEGISREGELMDYGVKLDIIDKSGAWFSYGSTKLGQGRENAKAFLKENEDKIKGSERFVSGFVQKIQTFELC